MTVKHRLTASLVINGAVASEIDGMRRALGAAALQRIPPHLTLVPPVNVSTDELDSAVEVLGQAVRKTAPIHLELGPPRTFYPATPVVYLAVEGDVAELSELRGRLLAGPLDTPAGRRAERDFVPHVTLDQNIDRGRIDAALGTLSCYRASVTIEEATLFVFDEAGRRWSPFASAPLGSPRVVGRGGREVELFVGSELDREAALFKDAEWAQYARTTYGDESEPDEPYAVTARVAGEVVGVATGQLRGRACRLGNLIVAAHERQNGVGTELLKAVERLALEKGADTVTLETPAGSPAEDFYRGRGYEAVTIIPAWRHGRDFLVMGRQVFEP